MGTSCKEVSVFCLFKCTSVQDTGEVSDQDQATLAREVKDTLEAFRNASADKIAHVERPLLIAATAARINGKHHERDKDYLTQFIERISLEDTTIIGLMSELTSETV